MAYATFIWHRKLLHCSEHPEKSIPRDPDPSNENKI